MKYTPESKPLTSIKKGPAALEQFNSCNLRRPKTSVIVT